jgi:hypothetical protein
MPVTGYPYDIDTLPNQQVDVESLRSEIDAAAIGQPLDDNGIEVGIAFAGFAVPAARTLVIRTADVLDGAGETTLDGVVGSHQGIPATRYQFHTSSKLVSDEKSITSDPTFEPMGGAVSSPSFFNPILSELVGKVIGCVKTDGVGAELQLTEDKAGSVEDKRTVAFALPDTSGVWQPFSFYTDVPPREGQNTYELMARLNGATSAALKYTNISVLTAK